MSSDNSVIEFSFDETKVVQSQGIDRFKQSKHGEVNIVSIVAFKKHIEKILVKKALEKGSPLTDAEKADLVKRVDTKLAERLGKKVEELTEVDRLDIDFPRFAVAWTHYGDGLGTIRCLSKWQDKTIIQRAACCNTQRLGDPEQTIVTLIVKYPMDNEGQVDLDLLKQHKYTSFEIWRMNAKKYKKLESVLVSARSKEFTTIDLKVQLDGDPKYQKQLITNDLTAVWARKDADPEVRQWILEEGLRNWKHIEKELGFVMTPEQLHQKLAGGGSAGSLGSGEAEAPKLQAGYDQLLD